jgi:predicted permease
MIHTLTTIIPIFVIILLGWLARAFGFMRAEFIEPANRLVFYLAIPAMVFRSISKASLGVQIDGWVVLSVMLSICTVFAVAWLLAIWVHLPQNHRGTFIQNSFHGNLGYIGLAVSYYFLGGDGFVRASILAGFMMILQNFLAVIALQVNSPAKGASSKGGGVVLKIIGNPIILAALAGMFVSLTALPVPLLLGRCLDILSDLALPLALLIIGASLSFDMMSSRLKSVLVTGMLKLLLMPAVGWILFRLLAHESEAVLPAIILLAAPTATVTYVMAKEMRGDSEFAVVAISVNTLLSAVTYTIWLSLVGP